MACLKRCGLALSALLLIAGCSGSEPTIDTTTDESLRGSMESVRGALPESKKDEFDSALVILALSAVEAEDFFRMAIAGEDGKRAIAASTHNRIHGLTGEEVIEQAEEVAERREREMEQKAREQEQRQRERLLANIEALEEKRAGAEVQQAEIDKFLIDNVSHQFVTAPYSGRRNIEINATVTNNTPEPISSMSFEAILTSPGRSVAWARTRLYYPFAGGVEPGESADLSFSPSDTRGHWANSDIPDNSEVSVVVLRLDGADGETLWQANGFSESDQEQLDRLRETYNSNAD